MQQFHSVMSCDLVIPLRPLEQAVSRNFHFLGESWVYKEAWQPYPVSQGNCGPCTRGQDYLKAIPLILVNKIKLANDHQPYFLFFLGWAWQSAGGFLQQHSTALKQKMALSQPRRVILHYHTNAPFSSQSFYFTTIFTSIALHEPLPKIYLFVLKEFKRTLFFQKDQELAFTNHARVAWFQRK